MTIQEYNEEIKNLFTEIKILVDEIYGDEEPAWLKNANPQKNTEKINRNTKE